MPIVFITKADGEREPFRREKLEASLARAGASPQEQKEIVRYVEKEIKDGMTTEEIYRRAFEMLKRAPPPTAARYSIKRAVLDLGPSGFPFEQFFAEVLKAHGWRTITNATLLGRCVPHEVDIVAERDGRRVGIEAKFHNEAGGKTDIKDVLYVAARYEDLKRSPVESSRVDEGWLVTNTRFTRNAIRYAQCSNLTVISWEHPRGRGLVSMIEEARVHPLTALTTLTPSEKKHLMENNVVLCKNVESAHLLEEYGVKPSRIPDVLEEARRLCTPELQHAVLHNSLSVREAEVQ